ncbi:granzyme G [Brachionichthys hirsutus]|uniref:granzyme G n=1 Tax=Brachionichthys hirsutus TaxID=412623 RepID=UPI0036050328
MPSVTGAAALACDLTMLVKLVIMMLALTLDGRVQAGEIIGGHEAVPHSRPYMVLIRRNIQGKPSKYCGGFLLSKGFVLTAAHCQASSYTVFLGLHNFNHRNETQNVSVEQAFPHEDFQTKNYANDIMILKLSSKAKLGKHVKPINFSNQSEELIPKSCSVSGWGYTVRNIKKLSPVLMEVDVTLVVNEWCPQVNTFCSEGLPAPGPGDSGGALVCEGGEAYGVVTASFTPYPGGLEMYTFTKISPYRRWINSIIKVDDKRW